MWITGLEGEKYPPIGAPSAGTVRLVVAVHKEHSVTRGSLVVGQDFRVAASTDRIKPSASSLRADELTVVSRHLNTD